MAARLLLALLALAVPAGAEEASLLRGLLDGDPGAERTWRGLGAEERVGLLRAALDPDADPRVRSVAARALDPQALSLEEVRRQAAVLATDAEWIRDPQAATPAWAEGSTLPLGSPDLPALWRTAAAAAAEMAGAREQLVYYHRALLPEHVPALVELLPRARGDVFHALARTLVLVADYTDEHGDDVARGLLYALERLRRARRGEPALRPEDVGVLRVPEPRFAALARAAWGLDRDGFVVPGAPSLHPPRAWLVRRARARPTAPEDVPLLRRVVWEADDPVAQAWAVRRLAALGDTETLRELAEGDDRLAALGAAERARAGEPARFLELLEGESALPETLAWYALPVEARRRRLGRVLLEDGFTDLAPLGRYEAAGEHGVTIRDEDLAWISENLLRIDAHPARVAAFFARVRPAALTADVAARVARRLRDERDAPPYFDDVLATLEVANRPALVGLLDYWATGGSEEALGYLVRLGEARHMPAMLEAGLEWGWVLGRVRDARVEAHLRTRAEAGDGDASQELAIAYGLPEPLRWLLHDPTDAQRRLVLARDPVGAALDAVRASPAEAEPVHVARLGLVRDERAVALLRELRAQRRHGRYWAATAGLALAGDAEARREFGALMREGRIWLLDPLVDGQVLTMGGEPEWIDFWLGRVNTSCCLSYVAITVLTGLYPTMPLEHDRIMDFASKERLARAWLDAHAFGPSRILDGLVPVPKPD